MQVVDSIKEEIFILLKLERFSLAREVWTYLTVKDIINLLLINKDIREFCPRINKDLPQSINFLIFDKMRRFKKKKILRNLFHFFPNINKLIFSTKDLISLNSNRIQILGMIGFSLQPLYKNADLQKSLKELKMNVHCDNYLIGISNLINITSLDLSFTSCNHIIREDAVKYLNNLTNDGLSNISSLTNITFLNLHGCCNLNDEGLSYLSSLVNINHLDLSDCGEISDEGLSHLSKLKNINYLDLSRSQSSITDTGLAYLSSMTNMYHLSLYWSHLITDVGLRNTLSNFTKITYLNLHCCDNITDEGFSYLSSNLINIQHLSLSNCPALSYIGLSHLPLRIGLTYLNLNLCYITDEYLFQMRTLINIKTLKLNYCRDITDIGLSYITSSLTNLEHLGIMQCDITDCGLLLLSSLVNLGFLQIEADDLTDEGLLNVSKISSLVELEIFNRGNLTDSGLNYLSFSLNKLKTVSIYNFNTTKEVLSNIFPSYVTVHSGNF